MDLVLNQNKRLNMIRELTKTSKIFDESDSQKSEND